MEIKKSRALSGTDLFVVLLQHGFCLTTVTFSGMLWVHLAGSVPVPSHAGIQQSHADKQAISGTREELVVNFHLLVAFIAVRRAFVLLTVWDTGLGLCLLSQRSETSSIS